MNAEPVSSLLVAGRSIGRQDPDDGRWLLQDVSIELRAGERVAVVGPSGSGKSLLLRALALLDPLNAGNIEWRGQSVDQIAPSEYRRQVIYVHQRPVLFEGDVESNLRRPFTLKIHRGRQYDRDRILRSLSGSGRDAGFLGRKHHELSGGEAQIVSLLRAIQLDPSVLLLDEPTAALDDKSEDCIESLIRNWMSEAAQERACILVSHDAEQAERISDRMLRLREGHVE